MFKNATTLEEIKLAVNANPLTAIDMIIEAVSEKDHQHHFSNKNELLLLFGQAVLLSQNIDGLHGKNDPMTVLFSRDLSQHTRHFIGVCLLRLLTACDQLFQIDSIRYKIFGLFDDIFSNDLYKLFNINKSDQTYIKERDLKAIIPTIEREISNTIESLNSFEPLSNQTFRKSFMDVFMSKKSQIIIFPFLLQGTQNALSLKLNDIFGSIEQYIKEPGSGILRTFEKTREELNLYLSETEMHGTKYSSEYLGKLIKKLLKLLEENFESSPFSKSANLVITKLEKKYPFSIRGRSFNLGFTVKNEGPGHAFRVLLKADSDLSLRKSELYLGTLEPNSIIIDIQAYVDEPMTRAQIIGELSWANFDGTEAKIDFDFELEGQRTDIDWENLGENNPYDLEPVSTENELVGRTEILNKLIALARSKSVGSSYIYGQKRVGKTSIAKTLKTRLIANPSNSSIVVYLETGDYKDPDARKTIENLGKRLCREIRRAKPVFAELSIPEFTGSLSPLTDFLENVLDIDPDCKILFILDEFDEIPKDLYRRSQIGDSFFLTIRSISGKPSFGFILVGGEKMEYLLNNQGEKLNKFEPSRVDYFDREKLWSDFKDLVQRPVVNLLEISDTAFTTLYEQTAGNPYFTKLICRSLFKIAVERRDSHVTSKEIEEATRQTLQTVGITSFQHFWEDGVVDIDERVEKKITIRRSVLIALAETLQNHTASKSALIERAVKRELSELDAEIELQEFVRRQVLELKKESYSCKVPFFEQWLQEKGINEIIDGHIDPDILAKYRQQEEAALIKPEEIIKLIKDRGDVGFYYKGQYLAEQKIDAWLRQFSTNVERRFLFRVLQHFTFYTHSDIRTRLKEAHNMVREGSFRHIKQYERRRDDILVSYLDGPGKSGASYASLYVEIAGILKSNVIERSRLKNVLSAIARRPLEERPHSLVFIDDFIGTGDSACTYFCQINALCGDLLRENKLRIFFIAISGFEQGKHQIEDLLKDLQINVRVRICDLLGEADKCFSEASKIFPDPLEREIAKNIAERYGSLLVPSHALGFGNCQATIAFEDNCPNNTLPIFWSDSKGWIPLFKRD